MALAERYRRRHQQVLTGRRPEGFSVERATNRRRTARRTRRGHRRLQRSISFRMPRRLAVCRSSMSQCLNLAKRLCGQRKQGKNGHDTEMRSPVISVAAMSGSCARPAGEGCHKIERAAVTSIGAARSTSSRLVVHIFTDRRPA